MATVFWDARGIIYTDYLKKFELLQHPPYSQDLAPSDEEIIAQKDAYFEDLPKSYFLDGLKKLEKRLEKCIELKRDYVEKYKKSTQNNLFVYLFLRTYWTSLVLFSNHFQSLHVAASWVALDGSFLGM